MGMNFYSACHKHKTKVFHFRSDEQKTMQYFYHKHLRCGKENVVTICDYMEEPEWIETYKNEWEWDDKKRDYILD